MPLADYDEPTAATYAVEPTEETMGWHDNTKIVATDYQRWRLYIENGRHRWRYLTEDEQKTAEGLSVAERYFLGLPAEQRLPVPRGPNDATTMQEGSQLPTENSASGAARRCLDFFSNLQLETGHWACEFTGTNVNIPGIIIVCYITGMRFSAPEEIEILRYLLSLQNSDGGWGIHIAGESTVYGTALGYVVLRLLGLPSDHLKVQSARCCVRSLGGVMSCPMIAKFWLAVLGILPWDAVPPVIPDIWLLPTWLPFAPWRWWVYPRVIHQSMSYIWSTEFSYAARNQDPVILELRREFFGASEAHKHVDWRQYHNTTSQRDEYHAVSWLLSLVYLILRTLYIPFVRTTALRRRAEEEVYRLIQIEDENTEYSSIAGIAASITMLARYIREGGSSPAVQRHRQNLHDYLWMTAEGMALNVTSGVQTWDTALAVQAIVKTGLHRCSDYRSTLLAAQQYLERNQMDSSIGFEGVPEITPHGSSACTAYRHPRAGAWGFSEKAQGYPVSDCTAEALKAVLLLQSSRENSGEYLYPCLVSEARVKLAVDIILTYQNPTGGCSCYETRRGGSWLESMNPAQIMDRLMIAYDYPECTGSCLTALQAFRTRYPTYRSPEISRFIERAIAFIKKTQREDGSWKGSWGICFTYAAVFTLEALASQGETYANSSAVRRACDFLIRKQNVDNGGWGEHLRSSITGTWHNHPDGSQIVQTAWALCALLEAEFPDRAPLERAISLLMRRQQPAGDFLQEDVEGAHQRSMVLKYPNYKFIFPLRALGMYAQRFEAAQ